MKAWPIILMTVSVLACGCGVSTSVTDRDELGPRERWILSMDRQFLPLRQEPVVVPEQFKSAADEVEREVSLDGYISGYDWVISAAFFRGTPVAPPSTISDDARLKGLWMQAYEAGCSNGLTRMNVLLAADEPVQTATR